MSLKNFFIKNKILWILLFFSFLSVCFVVPLSQYGRIAIASDAGFHFSRVEEIYCNLKSGSFFTFIATHTFHHSGVASFLFYPDVFLYPWALLRFFFNSVNSFYIWYGLINFLTLVISFGSMKSFSHNTKRSIFFALFYSFSAYRIYLGTWNYVIGEFIAATFLPLAFVGFYHVIWGDNRKWYLLSFGVTLLIYSHLLSVVITISLFTILTILSLFFKGVSWQRLVSLFKSILLTVVLSLWIIVPFMTDYVHSSLMKPAPGLWYIASFSDAILRSLSNATNIQSSIGIVLLVATALGWYFVKNASNKEKLVYCLGLILFCVSTNLFPWRYFLHTPLAIIQFPYRLMSFAVIFIAATASLGMVKFLEKVSLKASLMISIFLTLFIFAGYLSSLEPSVSRVKNQSGMYLKKVPQDQVSHTLPDNSQVDSKNYQNLFEYGALNGETDYYPNKSADKKNVSSILQQNVFVDQKNASHSLRVSANRFDYQINLKNAAEVDLPVVKYRRTYAYVNKKKVKITTSERGTVQVKGKKGDNQIIIGYRANVAFYLLFGIALLCWLGVFLVYVLRKVRLVKVN